MAQFCYLAFEQNNWNWKSRSASGIPSLLNQVPHFRHIIHALYTEEQNRDLFSSVFKAYMLTSSGEKELDLEPKTVLRTAFLCKTLPLKGFKDILDKKLH